MSDARTDAEREADLLDDAELGEMLEEAGAILSEPPRKHEYRDPDYKGGPRNKDEHEMLDAGIRLNAARIRRLIATLYDGPPAQHPVIVEILEALEDK